MTSTLQKLQDRQAALLAAMRKASDKIPEEPEDLSEEQLKEHKEKYEGEYAALGIQLKGLKVELDRELELQELERASIRPDPIGTIQAPGEVTAPATEREPEKKPAAWDNPGQFLQAVAAASGKSQSEWDPRLGRSAATGLGESIGSEGGFLVGTDMATELLRRTYQNTTVLNGGAGFSGCRRLPLSANSNSIKINAIKETSRADGSRWGGVQAYWIEEAGSKTASKPDFRQMELSLKKLIGLLYATDELLADATALNAVVTEAFAEEFAFKIQDGLINGTGAGMPLGIVNAGCLVSQSRETGQGSTIEKENIDKMWSRMWPSGVANSVWFINQQCYPELFAMTLDVGTGGMPVYLPPGGLSTSPFGTLMGRPVVPIEQCQALGTLGDILFCDLSQMLFCDKGPMEMASSIHVKFTYDESCFRFVYRCDAQPAWASALTPYTGGATATVGPFIALAVAS